MALGVARPTAVSTAARRRAMIVIAAIFIVISAVAAASVVIVATLRSMSVLPPAARRLGMALGVAEPAAVASPPAVIVIPAATRIAPIRLVVVIPAPTHRPAARAAIVVVIAASFAREATGLVATAGPLIVVFIPASRTAPFTGKATVFIPIRSASSTGIPAIVVGHETTLVVSVRSVA